jgi:predicted glycoside hydrolase/deacetylase ChbG (UPF0249 family)
MHVQRNRGDPGSMTQVVLCADDYAISAGVSRGILELAQAGRISATSAMSAAEGWPQLARQLDPVRERIGIGLHLTFTGLGPLGPMPRFAPQGRFPALRDVVRMAMSGRLPAAEIAAEIDRQLDAFTAVMGRAPDFVDGHQHVHALPGIRRALIAALRRRGLAGRTWLRDPADSPAAIVRRGVSVPKALAVAGLSLGFGAEARRAGFATNRGFAGFSPFDPRRHLALDFDRFFAAPGPAHLVMCHPGHVAARETLDDVVEARERELAFLASDEFAALMKRRGVRLVKEPG